MDMKLHSLNETPRSDRLHIAIFGRRNARKSSLINAITGHDTALVSETAGTTTDPVYKSMEIYPLGPCVLIDTAGFDDTGSLGGLRVEKTKRVMEAADLAVVLFAAPPTALEDEWIAALRERGVGVAAAVNKADVLGDAPALAVCGRRRPTPGRSPGSATTARRTSTTGNPSVEDIQT